MILFATTSARSILTLFAIVSVLALWGGVSKLRKSRSAGRISRAERIAATRLECHRASKERAAAQRYRGAVPR